MNHYLDIRLLKDPDFPPEMLMSALYSKLHRALYDLNSSDIGVSFPDHKVGPKKRNPGDRLRLHGSEESLGGLMNTTWLLGMRDHIDLGDISPVPEKPQHRIVKRRQFNTGGPSRAKRLAERHDIALEKAHALLAKPAARRIDLPFVQIASRSTGQRFALFIEHGALCDQAISGSFNHYGLSSEATVPWF